MQPTEAIVLDNVFPGVQDVALRNGCISWSTGYPSNIKTLMTYNGPLASKLFASTAAGIYDATTLGVVGAAVTACTNGAWKYVNFTNSGGSFLLAVNGVDNLKLYDGAAWTTVTGVSVPAITGVNTQSLSYIALHKRRIWFVERNSMNLWYLATDAMSGAATLFPVGPLFKRGGKITAIGTWSIDGGSGQDDYFVILTSRGQVGVYQGTDPTASTTWALVGVYDVGIPIGDKPLVDFGGDLLLLTNSGVFPMSKVVQSTILDKSATVSFQIDAAFLDSTVAFGTNYGWQMCSYKTENFMVVNVPIAEDQISYQYVMNTITKAWCRFVGWNASCWETLGNDLYFAGGTSVRKAWIGNNDEGSPIQARVQQAYNGLGYGGQKKPHLARINATITGSLTLQIAFDSDFRTFGGYSQISYAALSASALWDTGIWDSSLWDAGIIPVESKWLTVPSDLGYLHSFRLQLTTSTSSVQWTSTNISYVPAGIL